jgi:hypothetical protein
MRIVGDWQRKLSVPMPHRRRHVRLLETKQENQTTTNAPHPADIADLDPAPKVFRKYNATTSVATNNGLHKLLIWNFSTRMAHIGVSAA